MKPKATTDKMKWRIKTFKERYAKRFKDNPFLDVSAVCNDVDEISASDVHYTLYNYTCTNKILAHRCRVYVHCFWVHARLRALWALRDEIGHQAFVTTGSILVAVFTLWSSWCLCPSQPSAEVLKFSRSAPSSACYWINSSHVQLIMNFMNADVWRVAELSF